jgi:hypothetical protein
MLGSFINFYWRLIFFRLKSGNIKSRNSSFVVATNQEVDGRGSISSFSQRPDSLWGPPGLIYKW